MNSNKKEIAEIHIQFDFVYPVKNKGHDIGDLFDAEIITRMKLELLQQENIIIDTLMEQNILKVQCDIEDIVDIYFLDIGRMCTQSPVTYIQCMNVIEVFDILAGYNDFFKNARLFLEVLSYKDDKIIQDEDVLINRDKITQFLMTIFKD